VSRVSNLHLILWERVVIDQVGQTGIRCGTARGSAVAALEAATSVCVAQIDAKSSATTLLRDIGNLLDMPSDVVEESHCLLWSGVKK
jgi:hypothetical protein